MTFSKFLGLAFHMVFAAHVIYALIASPGDTLRARDAIEHAINAWNSDRAKSAGVVLLPRRWETDSVPLLGGDDGQSVINKQLVDEADIIFGVFHSRLGRKTARGVSGTAEEIARASSAKKQVHVYFAEMPHPPDVDPEQLGALKAFKATMEDQGLYGSFASEEELKAKVRTAIEYDLEHFLLGKAQPRTRGDAVILRARYESRREQYSDSKGRIKYRNARREASR